MSGDDIEDGMMVRMTPKGQRYLTKVVDAVHERLGDAVICETCGTTVRTFPYACGALNKTKCPAWIAIRESIKTDPALSQDEAEARVVFLSIFQCGEPEGRA